MFKSVYELRKIFSNFEQSKPLVFSCGSSITACILLVAKEISGENIIIQRNIIYDGSWTEFGTLEQ